MLPSRIAHMSVSVQQAKQHTILCLQNVYSMFDTCCTLTLIQSSQLTTPANPKNQMDHFTTKRDCFTVYLCAKHGAQLVIECL